MVRELAAPFALAPMHLAVVGPHFAAPGSRPARLFPDAGRNPASSSGVHTLPV